MHSTSDGLITIPELARDTGLAEPRRYVVDWTRVETELGTRLPTDYKEYVYWFGPGNFSDEFIVTVPGVENSNIELMDYMRREAEGHRYRNAAADLPPLPMSLFPEPGGWLPFLFTMEGCAVFWITEGNDPDRWKIGSRTRQRTAERFDGSFTEFLHEAIWDTIELEAIPEYGMEPPLAFRPDDGSWIGGGGGAPLEAYGHFEQA